MNDQTAPNMSNAGISQQFLQSLLQLRNIVETDQSSAAIEEITQLQLLFNQILQTADPNAGYQVRASLTEIHRLIRLLQRDLSFWQAAKQTRSARASQVLATLSSIEDFCQIFS